MKEIACGALGLLQLPRRNQAATEEVEKKILQFDNRKKPFMKKKLHEAQFHFAPVKYFGMLTLPKTNIAIENPPF